MHTVLAVLLWILLGLIGLIVLLLVLPVGVGLEYKEGKVSVTLRLFGFIPIPVYPQPEKGKAEKPVKKQRKKQAEKQEPAEQTKKKLPKLSFEDVKSVLAASGGFMKRIFRALHITKIILIVPVHADDAAKTALRCAEVQAGVGAASAFLSNFLRMRFECVHILPDFTGDIKAGAYFSCNVSALPIIMITAAVYALLRLKDRLLAKREGAEKTINQTEVLK